MLDMLVWIVMNEFRVRFTHASALNDKTTKFLLFPAGKIVIKSKNSQFKVTIPYRAHVLSGHLFVNESVTHFHLKDRWGFDEEQPNKEDSGSFRSSDHSFRMRTNTKENEDGDFVHDPIGAYLRKFPSIGGLTSYN
jgi:hypothetical protein